MVTLVWPAMKIWDFIKGGGFLAKLHNYQLLNEESTQYS
jgi:hypothetical protein